MHINIASTAAVAATRMTTVIHLGGFSSYSGGKSTILTSPLSTGGAGTEQVPLSSVNLVKHSVHVGEPFYRLQRKQFGGHLMHVSAEGRATPIAGATDELPP